MHKTFLNFVVVMFSLMMTFNGNIAAGSGGEKHFLMIAEPNSDAWKGVIMGGGDMADPAREAIESMGGKLLSYYIGVGESKNYGIVAFPDSYDTAKIIYLRSAQGLMKSMEFIEIIPSDQAAGLFDDVKTLLEPN